MSAPSECSSPRGQQPGAASVGMRSRVHACAVRLSRPALFVPTFFCFTMVGLWVESYTDLVGQTLLSVVPWAALVLLCMPLTISERARVVAVVLAATTGEIVGSIIWGLYIYRLENLPLFVPAGHGLVYLAGWRISQLGLLARHRTRFIGVVIALIATWGVVGLSGALGRHDVAGAVGCVVVLAFLLTSRNAPLIAGVFMVVAVLEIYGVWIGTWSWVPIVPGLRFADVTVGMGNPPSGAVSGYVGFDITGMVLGPLMARWLTRLRGQRAARPRG
ncbi:MAG: hypothetical protein ACRCYU_11610 [Nocardioides sp.]